MNARLTRKYIGGFFKLNLGSFCHLAALRAARAQDQSPYSPPQITLQRSIVFAHGLWADGSCFCKLALEKGQRKKREFEEAQKQQSQSDSDVPNGDSAA